jgi:uncharacterized cupin superfamily protein
MTNHSKPFAIDAMDVSRRKIRSIYPEPFASRMEGREKRVLGDYFGINQFGVNLTRLAPGAQSALLHRHSIQQELIYILEGSLTFITDQGDVQLARDMCAGFMPDGVAHQLVNRTQHAVVYLEIGDRSNGDEVGYPSDDLVARFSDNGE